MCGIYVSNLKFKEEELKQRLKTIEFRGPDFTGVQQKNSLNFGHLRLSILDLDERANQPMVSGSYTLVFNGEIYNYKDIKDELILLGHSFTTNGDSEVLLKGFIEWGKEVVHKLNGMFAFVIYNAATNMLFCSRDRLGVKPFYYYWKDGVFEICSQLKPISQNKTLNEKAISIYLDCRYIPSPYSIFNNVYKLPPGNNLHIDLEEGTHEVEEYWNLKSITPSNISYEKAVEEVRNLLEDSVRIRLNSDVKSGFFLSGGVDSALVTSIASNISKEKINTFSIGFDDEKYDESAIAATYADILGTSHKETICRAQDVLDMLPRLIEVYDEPFADSSALPSLLLNKLTKQEVTVALSGDGGDESFLGYNHFDFVSKYRYLFLIPIFVRRLLSKMLPSLLFKKRIESVKQFLQLENSNSLIEGVFVGFNSLLLNRDLSWLQQYRGYRTWSGNILQRTADLNIKLWLENDSNVKVDRASMAFSVEVRSPFLDYRIIEFARTLPVSYRYSSNVKKRILRDVLRKYIPEEVFNHPKKGFSIPLGRWIQEDLRSDIEDSLTDEILNGIPNLNVPKFKKMYREHSEGKKDNSSYIWRVYVLIKWLQNHRMHA